MTANSNGDLEVVGLHFHSYGKLLGFFPLTTYLDPKMCLRWATAILSAFLFLPPSTSHGTAGLGWGVWCPTPGAPWAGQAELRHCWPESSSRSPWIPKALLPSSGGKCTLNERTEGGNQVRKLLATEKNDRGRRYSCPWFWQCFSPGNRFLSPTCEWKISCVSTYFF